MILSVSLTIESTKSHWNTFHEIEEDCVYVAINTYWEALTIRLPKLPLGACWYQAVDTFEEEGIARKAVKPEEDIWIRERSVMVFEVGKVYE